MTKRALLVGINHYSIPGSDLRGCVNDVDNMSKVLMTQFGFHDVVILKDREATTKNIKDNLLKLITGATGNDTIVFHNSSHGSQIPDMNGDEIDKLDEITCPTDLTWDGNYISDDYLYSLFSKVPTTVQLVIISDSCHSGSLLRGFLTPQDKALRLPKFIKPPAKILENIEKFKNRAKVILTKNVIKESDLIAKQAELEAQLEKTKNYKARARIEKELKKLKNSIYANDAAMAELTANQTAPTKGEDFNRRNGILLSGCKSTETSADAYIDGKSQGFFTYALLRTLQENNYNITYLDLITKINKLADKMGYEQNPQLECQDQWKQRKFLL
jgi:hypothetical protein